MKLPLKINEYTGPGDLNELYQFSGLRFAFMTAPAGGSTLCHPWIKCKDYLHDMVKATVLKSEARVHGLHYKYGESPMIDLRYIRLVVKEDKLSGREVCNKLSAGMAIINQCEEVAKVTGRTHMAVKNDYVVIRGPAFWLKSPVLTSIFPLILRLCSHPKQGNKPLNLHEVFSNFKDEKMDEKGSDVQAGVKLDGKLYSLMRHYKDILEIPKKGGYDPIVLGNMPISNYHNVGGVISLINGGGEYVERTKVLMAYVEKDAVEAKALEDAPFIHLHEAADRGNAYFTPGSFSAAVVVPQEDGSYITHYNTDTCRESMVYYAAYSLSKHKMPTDKIRLVINTPGLYQRPERIGDMEKGLFFAKRIINIIEKKYGLKRSTIQRTVARGTCNKEDTRWLWVGSPVWLTTPTAFSILITLIRSLSKGMMIHNSQPEKMDFESVVKFLKGIPERGSQHYGLLGDRDMFKDFDDVMLIMSNWKKLFKKKDIEERWSLKDNKFMSIHSRWGINSLLKGNNNDTELQHKFDTLKKEATTTT